MKSQQSVKANKNLNKGGVKTKVQQVRSKLLASYYRNPAKQMKLVCITGTTGKVVVAHFVHEILKATGQRVAVLAADDMIKPVVLHRFLSDALKAGSTYAIITAPAVSLRDNVFYGLPISVAAITDFIPASIKDASVEEYLMGEKSLFEMRPEVVILNSDDLNYNEFAKFTGTKDTIVYGSDFATTVRIDNSKLYRRGVEANLAMSGMHFTVASFLTGEPVVHYMACAAAIALALGYRSDVIAEGIANYEE